MTNTRRVHTSQQVAGAAVDVIASWAPDTPVADIEEAIKAAARAAVVRARERTGTT